ncbi:MAG: AAA family ATPase [Patescibacteria group bacterium]
MIIGFLGKGGSGKSTLSTAFAFYLMAQRARVLAVDADHNMDMSYNFGISESMPYIGQSLEDMLTYLDIKTYRDAFLKDVDPEFSLFPLDPITEKYSVEIGSHMRLMSTGPHTENILYDKSCSHSLVTPLKVYLPFLKLKENEYAVVDEKAGVDGVSTGITTGFTIAVVVAEPTLHGLKTAKQIVSMLDFYGTPYFFALNKSHGKEDEELFFNAFNKLPDMVFAFDHSFSRFSKDNAPAYDSQFKKLIETLATLKDARKERTKEKYIKNNEFVQHTERDQ